MKLIFLDVDGVLNCRSSKSRCGAFIGIDNDKVKRLRTIVNETGAKIVLCSSWKSGWERVDKEIQDREANYLDSKLKREGLHIIDKTYEPNGFMNRGDGIIRWIQNLPAGSVEEFIILDDEVFDYSELGLLPHLVQTSFYADNGGITDEHAEWAIRLLNNGCDAMQHTCGDFVLCTECIHFEECDDKELRYGCYFGETTEGTDNEERI